MCKKITVQMLEKMHACKPQVELFKQFCEDYGSSSGVWFFKSKYVEVNLENLKKAGKYGLDIEWAIHRNLIPVDIIIESGDKYYSYYCLKYPERLLDNQFDKLLNNIIKSGDVSYVFPCLKFRFYSSEEQFNKLVDIIIESGGTQYSYYCLGEVAGLSKEQFNKLLDNIIKNGNNYYTYCCLNHIKELSEDQKKALQANIK